MAPCLHLAKIGPRLQRAGHHPPFGSTSLGHAVSPGMGHYRSVRLRGAASALACPSRIFRRPAKEDGRDFQVAGTLGHPVRVQLGAEHEACSAGAGVIRTASGEPFTNNGDKVKCVGGWAPRSLVGGQHRYF